MTVTILCFYHSLTPCIDICEGSPQSKRHVWVDGPDTTISLCRVVFQERSACHWFELNLCQHCLGLSAAFLCSSAEVVDVSD